MLIEDNENGEVAMIIDVTGTELIPGNMGEECLGNGKQRAIECCCDECDYLQCCIDQNWHERCKKCKDRDFPRNESWA